MGTLKNKSNHQDKKYCEKVDPVDLVSTVEIRKYIIAVETYLNQKSNIKDKRSQILQNIFFFGLGATLVILIGYSFGINL